MLRLRPLSVFVAALAFGLAPPSHAQPDDGWESVRLTTPDVWAVQALPGDDVLVTSRSALWRFSGGTERIGRVGGGGRAGEHVLYGGARTRDAAYAPGGYLFNVKRHHREVDGVVREYELVESWRDLGGGGWSFYGTLSSAPGGRVWGVVAAPDRRGWAAVDDDVWFYRGWDVTWEHRPLPDDARPRSLHLGPTGTLWAGTTAGLYRASGEGNGGDWEQVLGPAAFAGESVTVVREGAGGAVWAASASGRIQHKLPSDGEWTERHAPAPLHALYLHAGLSRSGTFAATDEGVFFSPDGASTWEMALQTRALDVDGNAGGIWAATGSTGLRYSSDDGAVWTEKDWRDPRTTYAAATYGAGPAGGQAPGTIVVGDGGAYGLFARDGEEDAWRPAGLGQTEGQPLRGLQALVASPRGQFYAVTREVHDDAFHQVLYRSGDGAQTWDDAFRFGSIDPHPYTRVTALAAGPDDRVLAGVYRGTDQHYALYHSSDAGESWTEAADLDSAQVYALAFGENGRAYAGARYTVSGRGAVYASADSGQPWGTPQAVGDDAPAVLALAVALNGAIVAGVSADHAVRSDDGGQTWERVDGTSRVHAFARGPAGVLVSTGDAVSRSADGGRTWTPLGDPGDYLRAAAVGPDGRAYVASSRTGLHRSAQTVVSAEPVAGSPAETLALSPAWPNPAGAAAHLSVTAGHGGPVRVEAFDVLGRRVAVLLDQTLAAGTAEPLTFRADRLPAGVYLVRAATSAGMATRTVVVQ